jgi:hypothetical protein
MGLLVILLLFSLSFDASATESSWMWVKITNNVTSGWKVSTGKATVEVASSNFRAQLYSNDSNGTLLITLNGTIKNGRLTVTETIHGSDYSGSIYKGTHSTKKWEEFAGTIGAESITLSDGWGMIGITRSISK